ncbi:glycosyltransferase family 4 protein [Aeromicrobium sp. Root495]|uniref:glycosyltransferase family 4 protein n=1 Tax=Aeromicrobium sp. Root495 TaxID=1736550 RepID=UPI0009E76794|nr:glycosyltransferase family 4 protein [Aeromicrobium sp. Root495]
MADSGPLRIQVHDFAGHPFQAQLSRELAKRGHHVDHAYAGQYTSGKGNFQIQPGDSSTLSFSPIVSSRSFKKYNPLLRTLFEFSYARAWAKSVREFQPDVVLTCNSPLFVLTSFARVARRRRLPWVLWHQDVVSMALIEQARKILPGPLAGLAARVLDRMERRTARSAASIVAIGDEFTKVYARWGLSTGFRVIPNWAPIDEVVPTERENAWSRAHERSTTALRLTYAGTLGKKHNPGLLVDLCRGLLAEKIDVELVVISEGEGADEIKIQSSDLLGQTIRVLPFQAFEDLPDVLGSSDVLVALLEPEASKFSIPSKVLTYLAAGRPVLGLMPSDNPAAFDIDLVGGRVFAPTSAGVAGGVDWLARLTVDDISRIGASSRDHAEREFNVEKIASDFENELVIARGALQ